MRKASRQPGFNLIEVVLSLGLFAFLIGMTIPVYRTFQVRNDVTLAAAATSQALRRAQWQARAGVDDADWGVLIAAGSVTLYQGTSYATRDAAYDDVYDLGSAIVPTGTLEYTFSSLSGAPTAAGSVTLTAPDLSTETISVGAYGQVAY